MKQQMLAAFGIGFFFATIASVWSALAYQLGSGPVLIALPYFLGTCVACPVAVWIIK